MRFYAGTTTKLYKWAVLHIGKITGIFGLQTKDRKIFLRYICHWNIYKEWCNLRIFTNKAVKTLHVSRIVLCFHEIVQETSRYLNIKEYAFIKSLLPIKIFKDKNTNFSPYWWIKFTILTKKITNEKNELIHMSLKACWWFMTITFPLQGLN